MERGIAPRAPVGMEPDLRMYIRYVVARKLKRAEILSSLQRALSTHGAFVQANEIFCFKCHQL